MNANPLVIATIVHEYSECIISLFNDLDGPIANYQEPNIFY